MYMINENIMSLSYSSGMYNVNKSLSLNEFILKN